MEYFKSGIKVAILFLVSCALLAYFFIHAGQVRVAGETHEFKILFSSVGNLKEDSPVTYSGFKVGQVIQIRPLSPEERRKYARDVEVLISVSKDIVIHKDSVAQVLSMGFLGEKYVEVSPGGIDAEAIPPGSTISGFTPKELTEVIQHFAEELDQMIPKIKDTLEKVHSSVDRVNDIVQEIANERKIQALLEGAQEATRRINEILEENRKEIKATMENAANLSGELKDQLHIAYPKIQNALDQMNKAVENLDGVLADARSLVKTNTPGIDRIIKNLEEASEHAKAFLKTLKEEPWRLLSKPRPAPVNQGPKRGFSLYSAKKSSESGSKEGK
ncbi:MAG: MCE family protein [Chlamydiae bacterium]|nr:MCE family protein [Chlamydiota bacterium]MBI3277777.1 MCE family protein [Chlamydiota bacterium]